MPQCRLQGIDMRNPSFLSSQKTHDTLDMLQRNRLSNVSFFVCSAGELVILAILAGILIGIHSDRDTESNTRALSIVCAYSAAVWGKVFIRQRPYHY
jgi:hypothetical protein